MSAERLDKRLVSQGLAATRSQAQRMIDAGRVESLAPDEGWQLQTKASARLPEGVELRVAPSEEDAYVSRGGLKLQAALEQSALDPEGWVALDLGQSTGGFTDCLLQTGAARVVGVEVGHDQLAPRLTDHPKVSCYEGINARSLPLETLLQEAPQGYDLAVMDLSFISQTLVLPGLPPLLKKGGYLLSLVKPQFEVGRSGVGKGGIVRDSALYVQVEARIKETCEQTGLDLLAYFPSAITGGDGNREFFVLARRAP